MDKEVLIDVNTVSRYYGDQCAVDNINFKLHRGEVVGFLGPNGAGKTTSMQIISGVLAANAGQVTIAGHDILDQAKQAKSHIGFLPESPPLYSDLTVDEYLNYTAKLRHIPRGQIATALKNCKQRCGLTEVGHRLIQNLSKGFQQRVGIAQAIIHSPSVVILDEPTSGLDPNQIIEIRDLIRELGQDHSVILSTHILPEVETVCDRVIIIHKGKLVLDQSLTQLTNQQVTEYRVGFSKPITIDTLDSLAAIQSVEALNDTRFDIVVSSANSIDQLIKHCSNNDWGLCELIPLNNSLEQTFIKLTQNTDHGVSA